MITKYEAVLGDNGQHIRKIECNYETPQKVIFFSYQGVAVSHRPKRANTRGYLNTWEEAREFLIEAGNRRVMSLCCRLDNAKYRVGQIADMRKPEEAP